MARKDNNNNFYLRVFGIYTWYKATITWVAHILWVGRFHSRTYSSDTSGSPRLLGRPARTARAFPLWTARAMRCLRKAVARGSEVRSAIRFPSYNNNNNNNNIVDDYTKGQESLDAITAPENWFVTADNVFVLLERCHRVTI